MNQENLTLVGITIHRIVSDIQFPLQAGFFLAVFGVILMVTAHYRARRHMLYLLKTFNTVSAKLSEAEKIGHFGSFTYDFEHTFKYWSQELFNLFGIHSGQKVPAIEWMTSVIPEKERVESERLWTSARTHPGPFDITMHIVRPTGEERFLRFIGKTDMTPERKILCVQGVVHDITKEVEIDRAKTEFVSLASHQLKTPLTSIGWLAEGMLSKSKGILTPEQEKYVNTIRQTTRHMMEMVNDLLNVSRIELGVFAIRIEEINIKTLLMNVVEEQRMRFEDKKILFTMQCEDGLPTMQADKSFVRMIFQNLLSNAIKYTKPGGIIRFEITHGVAKQESIFLRIVDNGIGIPKKEQIKVFQKLYRASNAQSTETDGTGLGLYVIKSIIERVKGGITFESIEDKGTTFYVTLPTIWDPSVHN